MSKTYYIVYEETRGPIKEHKVFNNLDDATRFAEERALQCYPNKIKIDILESHSNVVASLSTNITEEDTIHIPDEEYRLSIHPGLKYLIDYKGETFVTECAMFNEEMFLWNGQRHINPKNCTILKEIYE